MLFKNNALILSKMERIPNIKTRKIMYQVELTTCGWFTLYIRLNAFKKLIVRPNSD